MAAEWVKINNRNSFKKAAIYFGISLFVLLVAFFFFRNLTFSADIPVRGKAIPECEASFSGSDFRVVKDDAKLIIFKRSLSPSETGPQLLANSFMRLQSCRGMELESFCFGNGCQERRRSFVRMELVPRGRDSDG